MPNNTPLPAAEAGAIPDTGGKPRVVAAPAAASATRATKPWTPLRIAPTLAALLWQWNGSYGPVIAAAIAASLVVVGSFGFAACHRPR